MPKRMYNPSEAKEEKSISTTGNGSVQSTSEAVSQEELDTIAKAAREALELKLAYDDSAEQILNAEQEAKNLAAGIENTRPEIKASVQTQKILNGTFDGKLRFSEKTIDAIDETVDSFIANAAPLIHERLLALKRISPQEEEKLIHTLAHRYHRGSPTEKWFTGPVQEKTKLGTLFSLVRNMAGKEKFSTPILENRDSWRETQDIQEDIRNQTIGALDAVLPKPTN